MKNNLVKVMVTRRFLDMFFKQTAPFHVSIKGVPSDSELKNTYYDPESHCFYLIYYHESFGEVEEGQKIPDFKIEVTKHHENRALPSDH